MKDTFKIYNLMDLDFFLEKREELDPGDRQVLEKEDRKLYREEILPFFSGKNLSLEKKNCIILNFLVAFNKKKKSPGAASYPGEIFRQVYSYLLVFCMIAGVVSGAGAAGGFLAYSGNNPVNVTLFFFTFVVFQMLLLAFPLVTIFFSKTLGSTREYFITNGFFSSLIIMVGKRLGAIVYGKDRISDAFLFFQKRKKRYGKSLIWPFFNLAQLFGIAFNSGILGSTILRVVSTDLAFGWQSTLSFSHDAIFRLVKCIALPWTFIVGQSNAYPTLSQIEGSRIVLKEGSYSLITSDLVSWWPFLSLSVLTYILIPRLIFLGTGLYMQKRALIKYGLSAAIVRHFLMSLEKDTLEIVQKNVKEPKRISGEDIRVDSRIKQEDNNHFPPATDGVDPIKPKDLPVNSRGDSFGDYSLLIHSAVLELFSMDLVSDSATAKTGRKMTNSITISMDPDMDLPLLENTFQVSGQKSPKDIYLVIEGWMPPIRETLVYFMDLRDLLGDEVCIFILLSGRVESEGISTDQLELWKREIASVGDPGIYVETLV